MPSAWLAFLSECFLCCVLTLWGWSRESWELSVGWLYLEFKGERHHPLAAGPGEQEVGCRPHPLTSLDRVGLEVMQFATQQREDWRACPACLGLAGTTQKSLWVREVHESLHWMHRAFEELHRNLSWILFSMDAAR